MTEQELAGIEKYKSALWVNNLLSPSADGLICKLIAEIRRLKSEVERKDAEIEKANRAIEMLGGHPLTQEGR